MNEDLMNINVNLDNIRKQLVVLNKLKAYELKVIHGCNPREVENLL